MDWIKFGFGNELLEYHPTEPFIIDYSAARISDTPIDELAAQAIHRITETYPGPYTLVCSGGVDSQAMILAWLRSGVEFNIATGRFNGGMNDHDLENLWLLQKREGFEVQVLDLDVLSFHENELVDWAIRYQCASPHILTHMYICSKVITGTVIASGNYVIKDGILGGSTYMTFGLDRYARWSGQSVVPHFWMHDQELMPAFEMQRRKFNLPDNRDSYTFKCELFKLCGYDVIPQTAKYNGFEKIKEYYDGRQANYKLRVKAKNYGVSNRYYDVVFRYALWDILPRMSHSGYTVFNP